MVRSNVVARPPPRKIEQLIARQHPLRMFDECEEHVELRGTEIDQRVRRRTQLPSRHVQAPARKLEDPPRARGRSGYGHRRAPQDGTNAGEQLVDAKWLGKVIVRADFEAGHPIELRSFRREHDDRDGPVGAQPAADAEAVLARHHDVEDDEIDARRAHRLRHRSSILRNGHAKSVAGQEAREKAAQFLVVIDDQDVP